MYVLPSFVQKSPKRGCTTALLESGRNPTPGAESLPLGLESGVKNSIQTFDLSEIVSGAILRSPSSPFQVIKLMITKQAMESGAEKTMELSPPGL
jgi:hypothetical protein